MSVRYFVRQQREPQRRQADTGDERLILNSPAHERHEPWHCLIEQAQPGEQQHFMETQHLFDGRLDTGSDLEPPPDVFEGVLTLACFELAQAQETPSHCNLFVKLDKLGKRMPADLILIAVIAEGTQKPPALRPRGLYLKGLLIQCDGPRNVVGLSRGGGLRSQVGKGVCSRDQGDRKHE